MLTSEIAEEASEQYAREFDRYEKLARHVALTCDELVRDARIQATVQHRAKDPRSLRGKLLRYLADGPSAKVDQVASVRDALDMIGDLAGVRVATYVEADCSRVVELIRSRFRGPLSDGAVEIDVKTKDSGYRATHCQVLLPQELLIRPDVRNIQTTSAEIQVCSMLAHVWNEIEHDMRYKMETSWDGDASFRDQMLSEFHDAVDQGDDLIERLLGLRSERIAADLAMAVAPDVLDLKDFQTNGPDVLKEFVRLGYSTRERIGEQFLTDGWLKDGRALLGDINTGFMVEGLDDELVLKPTTADVIFALLLRRHARDLAAFYRKQTVSQNALRTARIAQAVCEYQILESPLEV